jgi:hypothetical protein
MLKIKKVTPMFTSIITTMDRYEHDLKLASGLISKQQGVVKEYQKVLAVGDSVRNIKVGDIVMINPRNYAIKKHQEGSLKDGVITDNPVVKYNFNIIEIDNKECLLLQDRDVDFIIDEYEEVEEVSKSTIQVPENKLII